MKIGFTVMALTVRMITAVTVAAEANKGSATTESLVHKPVTKT